MLKHYIDVFTSTYYIIQDDVIVFSIDLKGDLALIRAPRGVFEGDLKELTFCSENPLKKEENECLVNKK